MKNTTVHFRLVERNIVNFRLVERNTINFRLVVTVTYCELQVSMLRHIQKPLQIELLRLFNY